MFIDEVSVHAKGGRGGDGVVAFARQPFEPKGPPVGGDGGHGGSLILRASEGVRSLVDFHHRPHRTADRGRHGSGDRRRGSDGADDIVEVPVGTVVKDSADGTALADLVAPGDEYVAARGGRGGRGNAAFRTPRRRSPRFREFGEPGEERWLVLELKLAADVALVGFPSAGKSSLIARLSAARPKIADYPFTTLVPNLGVVRHDDVDVVVADVPGLIPGASEGRGLGHAFLRHVERARMLLHVLDCASYEQRDPREDLKAITDELRRYQPDLLERPALVLLNKADADPETAEIVRPDLVADGWEVVVGSAVTGEGLDRLRGRMIELVSRLRDEEPAERPPARRVTRPVLRPAEADFDVERTGEGFRVSGPRIERWLAMTDLDNEEAVAYLAQRLARAGVERALIAAGARRGDVVDLGGFAFDFDPEPGDVPEGEAGEPSDGEALPGEPEALEEVPGDADVLPGDADEAPGDADEAPGGADIMPGDTAGLARGRRSGQEARAVVTERRFPSPRRVVVKVGSSSLRTPEGRLDVGLATALVDQVADIRARGVEVVLVSSGAVAAGLAPLGLDRRPTDLPRLQAAASVGQGLLLHTYQERFAHHGLACGQALLTPDDVIDRARYLNARHTFETLLSLGAIPLVNENDTVATEGLRFGDNDRLAALVAGMLDARLLLLLTDVEGVLGDSGAIDRIDDLAELVGRYPTRPGSDVGSGGIGSKLEAARIATFSAAHAVIASARRPGVVADAISGEPVGTWCPPARHRPESRKLWIAFARTPRGALTVDAGAVRALAQRGSSLLAVGVTEVSGDFSAGDAVDVLGPDGALLARGLSAYGRETLECLRGRPSGDLDPHHQRAVIHRDSLVLLT